MADSPLKGKRVLIVDDEELLRKALIFDFERKGCQVFEAANGTEAFKIVETHPIDAVVSDVRMPNGSGVELLEKIRARSPEVPVVLLVTGFADLSGPEATQKGAAGLLDKPINRKLMMDLITNLLVDVKV